MNQKYPYYLPFMVRLTDFLVAGLCFSFSEIRQNQNNVINVELVDYNILRLLFLANISYESHECFKLFHNNILHP